MTAMTTEIDILHSPTHPGIHCKLCTQMDRRGLTPSDDYEEKMCKESQLYLLLFCASSSLFS
jgi:hypothetical protein